MEMKTAHFSGVDITFKKYEGTVQGHHKFVETNTRYSGGGGKIRTSSWTGDVSGDIAPVSSSTVHTYRTEFFLLEDNGNEVPVNLVNHSATFRDNQQITMYVVNDTQQIHKIINRSTHIVSVVKPLRQIISQSPHYFRSLIRNNGTQRTIWYIVLTIVFLWCGWIVLDIFSGNRETFTFIIGFVFMLPAYALYKLTKMSMNNYIANGLRKKIVKWD